jgi:hypothetical protein
MYPQAFLQAFWRMEIRPTVFVAMSFSPEYQARFEQVIAPAIRSVEHDGQRLAPLRVDLSRTGDSILTDILDGIAHSQLVLADVSSVGRDSKSGHPYRNGNVMYEVGIALACRHPSEVFLVRDDSDKFLFDLSAIPHMKIDFTDIQVAQRTLEDALTDKLREQMYVRDARVAVATAQLTTEEMNEIAYAAGLPSGTRWGRQHRPYPGPHELAISRLLDKQVVRMVGKFPDGSPAYELTQFGEIVAKYAIKESPVVEDRITST